MIKKTKKRKRQKGKGTASSSNLDQKSKVASKSVSAKSTNFLHVLVRTKYLILASASSKTCSSNPGISRPRPLLCGERSGRSSNLYGLGSVLIVVVVVSRGVFPDDIERSPIGGDEGGDIEQAEMVVVNEPACFCSAQGATGTTLGTPWTSRPQDAFEPLRAAKPLILFRADGPRTEASSRRT